MRRIAGKKKEKTKRKEKIDFHQVITLNSDGNKEYITTGATLNQTDYIALPTILGLYDTSDPTLRKYLKKYGKMLCIYHPHSGFSIEQQNHGYAQNGANHIKNYGCNFIFLLLATTFPWP